MGTARRFGFIGKALHLVNIQGVAAGSQGSEGAFQDAILQHLRPLKASL